MLIRTNVTNIGDPFIVNNGEHYYMYATSFDVEGFKVWKSDDMVEWKCLGVCLDLSDSWTCQDFWAPEVIYHKGKYIMHYTARRKEDDSLRIGVAVSEKPEGPFTDFHKGPMFDLGYAAIDGHVFQDDDGKAYLYFGGGVPVDKIDNPGTGRVIQLGDDMISTVGEAQVIDAPYIFEDSGIHKFNDKYYYTYCSNWQVSAEGTAKYGFKPPRARPAANVTACSSSIPTSKKRSGIFSASLFIPQPDAMAGVIPTILSFFCASSTSISPKTS